MKLKYYFLLISLLSLLFNGQLQAHQKNEATTRVIFNERTANIEIIHRFTIHDAEHASKQLFGSTIDILHDHFSQKQFANYVSKNFTLKKLSGEPLIITHVGVEIAGAYLWIYQETPIIDTIKGFNIEHSALTEIWSSHVNLLNIERNKKVCSLVFKAPVKEQEICF